MVFPPSGDNGFVTVDGLLGALPELGMPHFQRGQVWRSDSVSRLMESLIWDTPCGSIILWVPDGPIDTFGEPVPDWSAAGDRTASAVQFLVVDGQQRLTALRSVLDRDPDTEPTWALNLAALPELWPLLPAAPGRRQRQRPMVVAMPRQPVGASSQRQASHAAEIRDLVPLDTIAQKGSGSWPHGQPPTLGPGAELWHRVVAGVEKIRSRRLQVVVKRRTPLPEIVALYNRINSSGVPVRPEERGYAAMVSYEPRAADWLRDCFLRAHPPEDDSVQTVDRSTVLKRERERAFGFPLFVKTFAQAASHHQDRDGADPATLPALAWDEQWMAHPEVRADLLTATADVIGQVADVLRNILYCDDFRFLPSADPLRPVFTLMWKYPNLTDEVIARAILAGQVGALTAPQIGPGEVARRIRSSNTLGEALGCLPPTPTREQIRTGLAQARSMQDRWVSLLYWYERSRGACDYGLRFRPLSRESRAHKEHVVVFSLLHPAFPDLDASGHARSHEANSVGNLTFLSEEFNVAHGADPVNLDEAPPEFRPPHHLDDRAVRDAYRAAIDHLRAGQPEDGRLAYREFLRLRIDSLAEGINSWVTAMMGTQPADLYRTPAPQRLHPSDADLIRARQWPTDFQDAILALTARIDPTTGKWWVLRRHGTGRERQHVGQQMRLAKDGRILTVGRQLPGIGQMAALLHGLAPAGEPDSSQWTFHLDPADMSSTAVVKIVNAYLAGSWAP